MNLYCRNLGKSTIVDEMIRELQEEDKRHEKARHDIFEKYIPNYDKEYRE